MNKQKHLLQEEEIHDLFATTNGRNYKKDFIWIAAERIFFKKYINQNESWKWLDLGCGPAWNIKINFLPLMKKTDNYVGIDISKEMLKIARKNIPNGVFLKETMTSLKINDKFDYISFFGSLHHSPNPHFTLKNIVRFLKPDGYLFLREPSNKAFVKGNGLTLDEEGLDLVDLRNNLKKLGFYIVSFNTINSKNFNTIRRLLQRAHLSFWEKFIESWILKTKIEFFLQKILPSKITDNFGLDFLIVARRVKETKNKKKISKKKNSK